MTSIPSEKITRLVVIDEAGIVVERWDVAVTPVLQDDDRTLKIFMRDREIDR